MTFSTSSIEFQVDGAQGTPRYPSPPAHVEAVGATQLAAC